MTNRIFSIFLSLALLLTLAGCSASGAARALDTAQNRVEEKLDAAEDRMEDALRQAVPTAPASTESTAGITKADAEKIALDDAGFTADQVQQLHTAYEIDDHVPQYDVEFHVGDWEYEFEIHAQTGKILSFDKDQKYD